MNEKNNIDSLFEVRLLDLNIKDYIDILIKFDITPKQLLLCYLIYVDNLKYIGCSNKFIKTFTKNLNSDIAYPISYIYKLNYHYKEKYKTSFWDSEDVKNLINKELILPCKVNLSPENIKLSRKFLNYIMIGEDKFYEFYELYPMIHNSNGVNYRLKVCDIDKLKSDYNRIVTTINKHNHIIYILKLSCKHNLINVSIVNYINSMQWKADEEILINDGVLVLSKIKRDENNNIIVNRDELGEIQPEIITKHNVRAL